MMNYEYFPEGKEIFKLGDKGDKFYLILKGKAGVYSYKDE